MEEENGSGYNDNSNVGCLFGNDKHCRIPMEKSAIQAMEKANASSSEE